MQEPYDATRRYSMGEYGQRYPIHDRDRQSIVPVVIGLGVIVALLLLALFFGVSGEPTPAATTLPATPGQ